MKKVLIDRGANSTRVCVVEDGKLEEFFVEQSGEEKIVGNIYKGKVVNVLKGMQAAFVDIGLEKNGFLYGGDMSIDGKLVSHNGTNAPSEIPLKPGDIILCQVLKDQFGNKGPRVTMNISLPGRVLVLEPLIDYIGTSRKINDEDKKARLENFIRENRKSNAGYIIRTEAINSTKEELLLEIEELEARWQKIKDEYIRCPNFTKIYGDDDLAVRSVRDLIKQDVDKVIVNDEKTLSNIKTEFAYLYSKKPEIFELYKGNDTLVNHYGLNPQIDKLLKREVVLSNGAYLVIDRTEALTVIDANTGKYVGEKSLEDTVFMTNKIAAVEIARQMRLRNLGGIIIVDFIDMNNEEHKAEVLEILQKEMQKDRLKCTLVGMTELGLVQITRKKMRSMIDEVLLQPCPYCNGNSYVEASEHVVMRIRDYLYEIFKDDSIIAVKLTVNPIIFSKLFSLKLLDKELAEAWQNIRIYVIPDPLYHIEKFTCERVRTSVIELPNNAKLLY